MVLRDKSAAAKGVGYGVGYGAHVIIVVDSVVGIVSRGEFVGGKGLSVGIADVTEVAEVVLLCFGEQGAACRMTATWGWPKQASSLSGR